MKKILKRKYNRDFDYQSETAFLLSLFHIWAVSIGESGDSRNYMSYMYNRGYNGPGGPYFIETSGYANPIMNFIKVKKLLRIVRR